MIYSGQIKYNQGAATVLKITEWNQVFEKVPKALKKSGDLIKKIGEMG